MPKMMPFNELLSLIEENPINGAQEAQKRNDGVRVMNYESSVSAGALYRQLKDSPPLISAFYALPFWATDEDKKSYTKNPKHLNKHCHQFIYGAGEGRPAKRAEDHASATQEYFDDESMSLSDILESLKKSGGFDGLRKAAPVRVQRPRLAHVASAERKKSDWDDNSSDNFQLAGEKSGSGPAAAKGDRLPPKAPWPKMTMKKVFHHLLVAVEPEELDRFLADKSEVGDTFQITVQRDDDGTNGMLVWRAIHIRKVHQTV